MGAMYRIVHGTTHLNSRAKSGTAVLKHTVLRYSLAMARRAARYG